MKADKVYIELIKRVLQEGEKREDRTGVGTVSTFGERAVYDLKDSFPLLTTKKVWFKGMRVELEWFLKGLTNTKYLVERGVHIWDEWADEDGELGPVYGKQWRDWKGIDQISKVIDDIKNNPSSRRLIVSAWNVGSIEKMALPPCHLLFQFSVREGGLLDCQLYQRSADLFLGVPFNIASYGLLTHAIAHLTGLTANRLIHVMGDAHIYTNHLAQVREQIRIYENEPPRPTPQLKVLELDNINNLDQAIIEVIDYRPHPPLKGEVAV